jgi:hypothetical protein
MARRQRTTDVNDAARETAEIQIRAKQQEIKYDIRDFTVDYLVQQFRDGLFFVPPYQRQFVWPLANQSLFIESVILGFPIPMIFVADLSDGTLEIVDGAQRIQTLETFLTEDFALSKLQILDSLNGFRYSDLPLAQRRKLQTRALRVVVMEDVTSEAIRQEIFNRINRQGMRARGSEIRRGAFAGPFIEFIKACASDNSFRSLCPIGEQMLARREDEELVARFFCYSDEYLAFRHDVDRFIDKYVEDHREHFDRERMRTEFNRMLAFVRSYFPNGFAKTPRAKQTPRVRFEAISVGVNLALREQPNLVPATPPSAWLDSPEFRLETTTHASNSGPRLRSRIEFVKQSLLAQV